MYSPTRIRVVMVERGFEVSDLASQTGLSEATVRSILKGGDARVSSLRKIASVMGCSIADFCLPGVESKFSA